MRIQFSILNHLNSINTRVNPQTKELISPTKDLESIPLISYQTAANFGEDFFYIDKKSIKSNYIIPAFKHKKVDFLIQIEDNSMYPKHSCGDLVACKILKEPLFLQWNKVHVVSTKEQGILVKRIHQSSKGNFKMVSDNNEYLPFIVPKKQILGIALVVGVIRSE